MRFRTREIAQRNARIANMVTVGERGRVYRQAEVAEKFGLTQPRVSQIVSDPESHLYD